MNQKGFSPIIILLIVAGVLVVGWIWYYKEQESMPAQTQSNSDQSVSASTNSLKAESSSVEPAATTGAPTSSGPASITTNTVSPAPTSSWLTYTDPQDGFSFQYPPDYQIDSSTYKNILLLPSLGIRIYHKTSNQSILNFWSSATDFIVLSSTPMTVGGYPALYIVGEESPGDGDQVGTSDLLVVNNNTLIVDFFPSPFDALSWDNDPIPEAILNSLRF
jgi:hypothetical protein